MCVDLEITDLHMNVNFRAKIVENNFIAAKSM